jgi:protein gp37
MGNTKIEYLDKTWNFYTGCRNWQNGVCPVGEKCWAKSIDKRFGRSFEPQLNLKVLNERLVMREPKRIGVCFTGDLFGDWVNPEMQVRAPFHHWAVLPLREMVFSIIRNRQKSQFFFLTKSPNNYKKWGKFFENSYLGSSVCNTKMLARTFNGFADADAKNFWISFEPLMERIPMNQFPLKGKDFNISWVVIGGWSQGKIQPKIEWVKEIVDACDNAKIPVFLKNNLTDLLVENNADWAFDCTRKLRQEMPVVSP